MQVNVFILLYNKNVIFEFGIYKRGKMVENIYLDILICYYPNKFKEMFRKDEST